jgi:hypothetical protein
MLAWLLFVALQVVYRSASDRAATQFLSSFPGTTLYDISIGQEGDRKDM